MRNGSRFEIVAVMERNEDGRLHYHLAVEVPSNTSKERFLSLIIDTWRTSDFGYKEAHLEQMSDRGWINYMMKFRTKREFDRAIDWENFHLKKQSVV